MPRMLAPRSEFLRRSSNLQDSKTSLDASYQSAFSRRTSNSSDRVGSQLSLRPPLSPNQAQQHKHNAVWNAVEHRSVPGRPPSLDASETSVLTELSSSRSPFQSSLQTPSPRLLPKYDTVQRIFLLHRAPLGNHAIVQTATLQRSNNLHSTTTFQRWCYNLFFWSNQRKNDSWGQFVDVVEADEDPTRLSEILPYHSK